MAFFYVDDNHEQAHTSASRHNLTIIHCVCVLVCVVWRWSPKKNSALIWILKLLDYTTFYHYHLGYYYWPRNTIILLFLFRFHLQTLSGVNQISKNWNFWKKCLLLISMMDFTENWKNIFLVVLVVVFVVRWSLNKRSIYGRLAKRRAYIFCFLSRCVFEFVEWRKPERGYPWCKSSSSFNILIYPNNNNFDVNVKHHKHLAPMAPIQYAFSKIPFTIFLFGRPLFFFGWLVCLLLGRNTNPKQQQPKDTRINPIGKFMTKSICRLLSVTLSLSPDLSLDLFFFLVGGGFFQSSLFGLFSIQLIFLFTWQKKFFKFNLINL